MSKVFYDNFIGFYENAFADELCDELLQIFSIVENSNALMVNERISRKDTSFVLSQFFEYNQISKVCNDIIWQSLSHYVSKYEFLKNISFYNPTLRLQKTDISGGFHQWHCENPYVTNDLEKDRILAWMVYLNDDFEGGETEYLHFAKRVNPKKGTLMVWPTGFTHLHRGNQVLGGNPKYILTGWIYYHGDNPNCAEIVSFNG